MSSSEAPSGVWGFKTEKMEQNEEIEMQLWEYLDGTCSIDDMPRIAVLIERDPVWKAKYEELSAFHSSMGRNLDFEQPSLRFTQNVMDAVAATHVAPATKKYINKGIIRGIAALFIGMITAALGYAFANAGNGAASKNSLPKLNLGDLSGVFNSGTMMMIIAVNIVIGLVFLDSLLRRKRTQLS